MRLGWMATGRGLGLAFVLLGGGLATPAAAQRAGTYDMRGVDPEGENYRGTVELRELGNGVWFLRWTNTEGASATGIGLVRDGVLSASFLYPPDDDGKTFNGVGVYQVLPNGSLDGVWSGGTGRGTETLTLR